MTKLPSTLVAAPLLPQPLEETPLQMRKQNLERASEAPWTCQPSANVYSEEVTSAHTGSQGEGEGGGLVGFVETDAHPHLSLAPRFSAGTCREPLPWTKTVLPWHPPLPQVGRNHFLRQEV